MQGNARICKDLENAFSMARPADTAKCGRLQRFCFVIGLWSVVRFQGRLTDDQLTTKGTKDTKSAPASCPWCSSWFAFKPHHASLDPPSAQVAYPDGTKGDDAAESHKLQHLKIDFPNQFATHAAESHTMQHPNFNSRDCRSRSRRRCNGTRRGAT
jgi:hypothetical protein